MTSPTELYSIDCIESILRWHPALLPSEFEILEMPEDAIRVDVNGTPDEIASEIRRRLGL